VRGERHEDKIRFKGKDVERVFQMDNLRDDVQKKHTEYTEKEDYEFLFVENRIMSDFQQTESPSPKSSIRSECSI